MMLSGELSGILDLLIGPWHRLNRGCSHWLLWVLKDGSTSIGSRTWHVMRRPMLSSGGDAHLPDANKLLAVTKLALDCLAGESDSACPILQRNASIAWICEECRATLPRALKESTEEFEKGLDESNVGEIHIFALFDLSGQYGMMHNRLEHCQTRCVAVHNGSPRRPDWRYAKSLRSLFYFAFYHNTSSAGIRSYLLHFHESHYRCAYPSRNRPVLYLLFMSISRLAIKSS